MDDLNALTALGFSWPSPAYLFGSFVFSILGWMAYRYGKKTEQVTVKWLGVALMLYPYFISETWALYLVGCGLCGAIYWWR